MSRTPEGKVKRKVSELLSKQKRMYYEMPVPSGFGKTTLDYIGCHYGRFFAIETKAPGGKPTDRQSTTIAQMEASGAKVFVVIGDEGMQELTDWLTEGDWLEYEFVGGSYDQGGEVPEGPDE